MSEKFDLASRIAFIAFAGLLPVFFVPLSWITVPEAKMMIISLFTLFAALCYLLARIIEGEMRFPATVLLPAALLPPLAYVVSALVTGWNVRALVGSGIEQDTITAVFLMSSVLVFSVLVLGVRRRFAVYATRALMLGALVLFALQLLHLVLPALPLSAAIAGQTGNAIGSWHELSIAAGLFLLLSLTLLPTAVAGHAWRYVAWALALLSFLMLIIGGLFDVWLAVAFFALCWLGFRVYSAGGTELIRARTWAPQAGWMALVAVAVAFALLGPAVNAHLPGSLRVGSVDVRPSLQGTLEIGQHALSSPLAALFGTGPNTFVSEWGLYKPVGINQTLFWNIDFNTGFGALPTSVITTGFVGALAWLLFIAAVLFAAAKAFKRTSDPLAGAMRALMLAGVYLIAFHVLYAPGPALNALTFLIIGLGAAYAAGIANAPSYEWSFFGGGWPPKARLVAAVIAGAILALAAGALVRVLIAESLVNHATALYGSGDLSTASALVTDAVRIDPTDDTAHRVGVLLGLAQFQRLLSASSTATTTRATLQASLQKTIGYGLSAVRIDSADYQNWLDLASLYQQLAGSNVTGAYENARAAYQKAAAENPTNPLPLLELASLANSQGEATSSLEYAKKAIALKPDYADAYYLVSQVYASMSDFANATTTAAAAVRYAPNDPTAWYNLGAIAYAAGENYAVAAGAENKALALEPQYADALYVEGLALYKLGRPTDAQKAFKSLDALDPGQPAIAAILKNLAHGDSPLYGLTATSSVK